VLNTKHNSFRFRPFLIGVAGGTGSGKSFLTERIAAYYERQDIAVLDYDSYYKDNSKLPLHARHKINFDHPSTIDHDLLLGHVKRLLAGQSIGKPVYNFAKHVRSSECKLIAPARIILLEGIFALWDKRVRALMDYKLFVDADSDLRFIRRLQRDVVERGRTMRSVIEQYLDSVRPMHIAHIEPTKAFADTILDSSRSLELRPILSEIHLRVARHFMGQGWDVTAKNNDSAKQLVGSR
jgi:uridine kinase